MKLLPLRVLMLDVGLEPQHANLPETNLYELRKNDHPSVFPGLIGEDFRGVRNLRDGYVSPKLKSPGMEFVCRSPRKSSSGCNAPQRAQADDVSEFDAVISYAAGGLANAWGAGTLRFDEYDCEGFPWKLADLEPYYDELTDHIGISGEMDDLTPFLGTTRGLQAPQPLGVMGTRFMSRYAKARDRLAKQQFYAGRPRMAVLTAEKSGRAPYQPLSQDYFTAHQPGIYTPYFSLLELKRHDNFTYRGGMLVERFEETASGVSAFCKDVNTGTAVSFAASRLVLAAGALNSGRIVLQSFGDCSARLPLLDNPVSWLPFIDVGRIGMPLPTEHFTGCEIFCMYHGPLAPQRVQGSLYGLHGPLRTDLVSEFPLSIRGNLALGRYLLPALGMLQLFFADSPKSSNYLRLREDGSMEFRYQAKSNKAIEAEFARILRSMGYVAFAKLARSAMPGSSIHYAGTLLTEREPRHRFQTHVDGSLAGARKVRVADAATFPQLPAKNLTLTIMANSMRIAADLAQEIGALGDYGVRAGRSF